MDKFDIFLCYRGNSSKSGEIGTKIYKSVEKYKVFFAPESLEKGDNFKSIIPKIMKNISIVILLLDIDFFDNFGQDDDIVEYECQEALKNLNILFLPIYINDFSFNNIELDKYFENNQIDRIKHINGIKYSGLYDFSVENDLMPVLNNLFNGGSKIKEMSKRSKYRYYGASEHKEQEFLKIQQDLLYDFDNDVYKKILKNHRNLVVLDIGCNDGYQTIKRFGNNENISKIVAIDRDEKCIEYAKMQYKNEKYIFEKYDVEDTEFTQKFELFLQSNNIQKFDIINISMLLLHLKRPSNFLRIIKKYLNKDGIVFIRDIDDGLNFAYPDFDDMFKKMISICEYCDILGYRKSGREIYSYLKDAGYTKVVLEKSGLNTSNMNDEDKETLFEIYFGYIPTALEKTINRTNILTAKLDYEWVLQNIDDVKEKYMKNNFIFSLGYVIYTAKI